MNAFVLFANMIRYNIKVIFAGRFGYFLLAAFSFFVFITTINLFEDSSMAAEDIYYALIFPGLLLIFYPTSYGIQNEDDSRMLEIIFGIPNYRYKVWLVRLFIIFSVVYCLLLGLCLLSHFALHRLPIWEMAYELMFPVFFIGSLAFMFSTVTKSGNGTAVVMVVIGMVFWISSDIDIVEQSYLNIFLNPFDIPRDMNESIWRETAFKNRIFLVSGTVLALLAGLFNLQSREKFV